MPISPLRITALDLDRWSTEIASQSRLPSLVRQLIFAVDPAPQFVEIPGEEGVQRVGWDGRLRTAGAPPFVPAGESGWEISVRRDVAAKAEKDFSKRSQDPLGLDPAESTFVFVTSRIWPGKSAWARSKTEAGPWKQVLVRDAEDLEMWLERAPAVQLRLAREIRKHPVGALDLATYLAEEALKTNPPLPPELIIGGRDEEEERLRALVTTGSPLITIRGDSIDEALAFLGAVLDRSAPTVRDTILSRGVVVDDRDAWRALVAEPVPLILIPRFEDAGQIGTALDRHQVILPLGPGPGGREHEGTVVLPRSNINILRDELERIGISGPRRDALAAVGHRSFPALRRQLGLAVGAGSPRWAAPDHGCALVPALLAGGWIDASAPDQEVLTRLANRAYDDWSEVPTRWAVHGDPPLKHAGGIWRLVANRDAWEYLHPLVRRTDLERLEEACLAVFGTSDPLFDLSPGERWAASALSTEPRYSEALRRGLANSLAILGSDYGTHDFGGQSGREWAARIVITLLRGARGDWKRWASIGDILPLLAEAEPDGFLNAVEREVRGAHPTFALLFQDEESLFGVRSPHHDCLWALERLAWPTEHFGRVCVVIAALARLDLGGTTSNRPLDTLTRIFLPFRPHTSAPAEVRREILDRLVEREPEVGWKLTLGLIPDFHLSWTSTARPRYRTWAPEEADAATWGEVRADLDHLAALAVRLAGRDGGRWAQLLQRLPRLSGVGAGFETVVNALVELPTELSEPTQVVEALRDLLSLHRRFQTASWTLPTDAAQRLGLILERFEPTDPVDRFRWLFRRGVAIDDLEWVDGREGGKPVGALRTEAIRETFSSGGLSRLFDLAQTADPHHAAGLGFLLGGLDLLSPDEEAELSSRVADIEDEGVFHLVRGFVKSVARSRGEAWLGSMLNTAGVAWSAEVRGRFLLAARSSQEVWDLLESTDPDTIRIYWTRFHDPRVPDYAAGAYAAGRLIEHGRPLFALSVLHLTLHDGSDPESWDPVLQALTHPGSDPAIDPIPATLSWQVDRLLERIERAAILTDEELALIEWGWIAILRTDRSERPDWAIHRKLGSEPAFFVEMITRIYRSDQEETSANAAPDPGTVAMAEQCHHLLRSWSTLPGLQADGTIDSERLWSWTAEVLERTRNAGRAAVGALSAGEVLSRSPDGTDGHWPHEAVREAIERADDPDLERGFANGRFNGRGVTTRWGGDGGMLERDLAERYEAAAAAMGPRWIRAAVVLRELVRTYRELGAMEDRDADWHGEVE